MDHAFPSSNAKWHKEQRKRRRRAESNKQRYQNLNETEKKMDTFIMGPLNPTRKGITNRKK